MTDTQPRFEFRVWGRDPSGPAARLQALSDVVGEAVSEETYVVAMDCDDVNLKIRDGVFDVKVLMAVSRSCEQWQPWIKADLPVPAALLAGEIMPRLGITDLALELGSYDLSSLIDDVVRPHPRLHAAAVSKRRLKYVVAGCLAEVTDVVVNDHEFRTVAAESVDLHSLGEMCRRLGIEGDENVSYPRAIKRALGLENW